MVFKVLPQRTPCAKNKVVKSKENISENAALLEGPRLSMLFQVLASFETMPALTRAVAPTVHNPFSRNAKRLNPRYYCIILHYRYTQIGQDTPPEQE